MLFYRQTILETSTIPLGIVRFPNMSILEMGYTKFFQMVMPYFCTWSYAIAPIFALG